METALIVLLAAALSAAVAVALTRGRTAPVALPADPLPELERLRGELRGLADRVSSDTTLLSQRLEGIDSRMVESQRGSVELARNIFDTLGEVRSATASVAHQAREFSSLQDLLKPPKARGGIGEAMLEELLRQVLPPQAFSLQHRFTSGVIVDAVVQAAGKRVCIDSKFPLSNYRRMCDAESDTERAEAERAFAADVERHIRDIAKRYIVPDEGTFDFAVMYVPAEGVYAEVLRLSHRRRPLFEVAIEARVVPMSPLTMFGYLQTILFGLKCLRIEKRAEEILGFCGRLQQDIGRFASEYETLGKHLHNARAKYEEGAHRLDRFRGRLDRVADLAEGEEETRPTLEVVGE